MRTMSIIVWLSVMPRTVARPDTPECMRRHLSSVLLLMCAEHIASSGFDVPFALIDFDSTSEIEKRETNCKIDTNSA